MPDPKKLYRAFHGKRPPPFRYTDFYNPKKLIYLGRAVSIVYESSKRHGGGDGQLCEYEHDFDTDVFLYMDDTAKRQLYLIGKDLKVSDAGIEN